METDKHLDTLWGKTKAWASKNRTVSGALAGFAAGTVVPGVGNVLGAIVGAGIGYASAKEKARQELDALPPEQVANIPTDKDGYVRWGGDSGSGGAPLPGLSKSSK